LKELKIHQNHIKNMLLHEKTAIFSGGCAPEPQQNASRIQKPKRLNSVTSAAIPPLGQWRRHANEPNLSQR
jgi:hypothetical protein